MFVPKVLLDWLHVSKDYVSTLKEEAASLRGERDALRGEVVTLKVHCDYFRVKVNQLEAERAALLEKAYGIHIPVPQVMRQAQAVPDLASMNAAFSFEDVGDVMAKQLGFPTYDN